METASTQKEKNGIITQVVRQEWNLSSIPFSIGLFI
jgi:hypothetical protein